MSRSLQQKQSRTVGRNPAQKAGARPRRVLVGHQRGASWHLLVAEAASPDGRKARVLEAVDAGADPGEAMSQLMEKHKPDRSIGVLASGDAVCRTVEIPEGHDAELADAASLLAEAELPPTIPGHRKVGGAVSLPAAPGFRTAFLVGWPERGGDEPLSAWDGWTSELVGLTELLLLARVGGAGAPRVIASVDRRRGCIGVVGAGVDAHAVRSVLEDPSEPESFDAATERCIRSVAQKVGAPENLALGSGLLADTQTRGGVASAVAGSRDDEQWFASFGVALGVACAALRATPASTSLFDLRSTPANIERSAPERLLLALQRARTAGALLVAGLALALLLPLGFSYARLVVLEKRVAEAESALGLNRQATTEGADEPELSVRQQLAMYQALDRYRWPMAKLLADISAALPAESPNDLSLVRQLNLTYPDGFSIVGVADSVALVNLANESFKATPVFSGAGVTQYRQVEGAGGATEFELVGRVNRPYFAAGALPDYADRNLAERIYDEEGADIWRSGASVVTAVNRTETASSRSPSRSPRSPGSSTSRSPARAVDAQASSGSGESSAETATAPDAADARTERREMFQGGSRSGGEEEAKPIPDALADEAIAELTQQEAMREMVNRRSAARQDNVSDDVRRRLEEEVTKLRNRAREAQQGGG